MSQKGPTRDNSQIGITSIGMILANIDRELFYMSHGIRKRKIFYNVQYTEEEEKWINTVR